MSLDTWEAEWTGTRRVRGRLTDPLEDVVDERVEDEHGLVGDTSVRVDLLEDLVDVRGAAGGCGGSGHGRHNKGWSDALGLLPGLPLLLLVSLGGGRLLDGRLLGGCLSGGGLASGSLGGGGLGCGLLLSCVGCHCGGVSACGGVRG